MDGKKKRRTSLAMTRFSQGRSRLYVSAWVEGGEIIIIINTIQTNKNVRIPDREPPRGLVLSFHITTNTTTFMARNVTKWRTHPLRALSLSLGNPVLYATNQRPSNKSNTRNLVPYLTSSHSKIKNWQTYT